MSIFWDKQERFHIFDCKTLCGIERNYFHLLGSCSLYSLKKSLKALSNAIQTDVSALTVAMAKAITNISATFFMTFSLVAVVDYMEDRNFYNNYYLRVCFCFIKCENLCFSDKVLKEEKVTFWETTKKHFAFPWTTVGKFLLDRLQYLNLCFIINCLNLV